MKSGKSEEITHFVDVVSDKTDAESLAMISVNQQMLFQVKLLALD